MELATTFTPQGDGNLTCNTLRLRVYKYRLATTFTPQGDGNGKDGVSIPANYRD